MRCIEPHQRRFPADPQLEQTWAELAARSLGQLSLNEVRDHVTKALLTAALERAHYNYSKAAELLGVTRQSVQYLVARHEPRLRSDRPHAPHARLGDGST